MNVIDSSAWLEYLAEGPNAGEFSLAICDAESLLVPSITIYEVFKRVAQQRGTGAALQAVALMRQGRVIDVDADLAIAAADLSIEHQLPMADSIILASARRHEAVVWTQDADFEGMTDVEYRRPRKA